MVGRLVSFWNGLFLGAMLVSGTVILKKESFRNKMFCEVFVLQQKRNNDFESCDGLLPTFFVRDVFVASKSYG